jgi:Putative transposase
MIPIMTRGCESLSTPAMRVRPKDLSSHARPEAMQAYLSRYTHRVAIANSRLIAVGEQGVTFKWKDYRIEAASDTSA